MRRFAIHRSTLLALAALLTLLVGGCSGEDPPEPVSLEEQQPITTEGFEGGDTGGLQQGKANEAGEEDEPDNEDGGD